MVIVYKSHSHGKSTDFTPVYRQNGLFLLETTSFIAYSFKKIQITKLWAPVIAMFQKSLDQCVAEKKSSELIKAKHRQYISSPRLGAICTIQHLLLLSFASSYLSLSTGRQSYLQRSINALVFWLLCFSWTPKPEYPDKNLSVALVILFARRWWTWWDIGCWTQRAHNNI